MSDDNVVLRFSLRDHWAEVYIAPEAWTKVKYDPAALYEIIRVLEWGAETQCHVVVAPPPRVRVYEEFNP